MFQLGSLVHFWPLDGNLVDITGGDNGIATSPLYTVAVCGQV